MATTSAPKSAPEKGTFDSTLESAQTTMVFGEIVSLAIDSFRASKARFMLTMLGMVIGSASIILVVTVGLTGKQYALGAIESLGPNKIEMQYSGGSIIGPDNTTTPDYMTREDMQRVLERFGPAIVASSPMLEDHDRISMGGGITKDAMILGVSPQYKEVRGLLVARRPLLRRSGCRRARQGCGAQPAPGQRVVWQRAGRHRPDHLHPRHSAHRHRRLPGEHRHLRDIRD